MINTLFSPVTETPQMMRWVLYALLPGIILMSRYYGSEVILNLIFASSVALLLEAVCLYLRKQPLKQSLKDSSILVTAWLLVLSLPVSLPWWQVVIGLFFAVVIAKHIFGGLGHNIFNPAMVAYCVLLISFPVSMTHWPALASPHIDATTSATPLDTYKKATRFDHKKSATLFTESSSVQFKHYLYLAIAWAIGGVLLLLKRIITWQIPFTVLASIVAISFCYQLIYPDTAAPVLFHLITGASIFGAFFIATDPITAATTPVGKVLFGLGIGVLCFIIRQFGNYPDGFAFAVLLMNLAAPTLDKLSIPRPFGDSK